MTKLHPYLTFSGNCREALIFYQQSLGGQLYLQTVEDSPLAERLPQQMKDCILHALLKSEHWMLMASDMVSEDGLQSGNNVSIHLECQSQDEMEKFYSNLAIGGVITYPPSPTYGGAKLGTLIDKFGIRWQINLPKEHL